MNHHKLSLAVSLRHGLLAFLLLAAFSGFASATSILGDTVQIQYRFPDISTLFGLSSTGVVTEAGLSLNLFNNQLVTVFADHVDILGIRDPDSFFTPASFNGVSVNNLTHPGIFTAASADLASTVVGFDNSRVSINSGVLFINMQALATPFQSLARTDFTSTAPEPSSLLLLSSGLILAGAMRKRLRL